MGARGPKPLPKNVHAIRGNPSKLPLHRMGDGFEPPVEIPNCPKHLIPEARKEWRRMSHELAREGMIAKVDRAAFALYCQWWARWVWHETLLQRDIDAAAAARAAHEMAEDAKRVEAAARGETCTVQPWSGGDGFQVLTVNGNLTYNPHWSGAKNAALMVDRFLASFGLSPSSRGRVSPSSRQPYLPGFEPPKGGFDAL